MSTTVTIAPDHWLAAAPAASYARMRRAGMPAGMTSAGRSRARQAELRRDYLAGRGAFALPPGKSRHEDGEAMDVPRAVAAWLDVHGRAHGWRRTNPDEWWHYEYFIDEDKHREDDDMPTAEEIAAEVWRYRNERLEKRDAYALLRDAEEDSAYARRQNLVLERRILSARAELAAQVKGLVGAVAALSRGEPFDEAKLLDGIRRAAAEGVRDAVGDALDVEVTVTTPRKE